MLLRAFWCFPFLSVLLSRILLEKLIVSLMESKDPSPCSRKTTTWFRPQQAESISYPHTRFLQNSIFFSQLGLSIPSGPFSLAFPINTLHAHLFCHHACYMTNPGRSPQLDFAQNIRWRISVVKFLIRVFFSVLSSQTASTFPNDKPNFPRK